MNKKKNENKNVTRPKLKEVFEGDTQKVKI
jgi:hypothetical protein